MSKRLILALLCLLIFIIFAVGVIYEASWISGVDAIGERFLRPQGDARHIHLFEKLTTLGSATYLAIFTLFIAALLWVHRKRRSILPYVMTSLLSSFLVNDLFKPLIQRPRPPYKLIEEWGYSFPSGHSTSATVVYGLAIALACLYLPKRWHKLTVGIFLSLVIAVVMWSRVYLGVHYLSDTLGGLALGLALIYLLLAIKRW